MPSGSPAKFRKIIRKRITHQQELEAFEGYVRRGLGTDEEFCNARGKGINWELVRRINKSKKTSFETKIGLRKVVTGSVITASDLTKMGFVVGDLCPLCKGSPDGIFHRAWLCPERPVREKQCQEVVQAAIQAGPQSILYTRGLATYKFNQNDVLKDSRTGCTENWTPFDPEDGEVFHDGSCFDGGSCVGRAGWAAVQINDEGNLVRGMWGNVPPDLEQTANYAEHYGFLVAAHDALPQCDFTTDCATIKGG